jgi:integrase
VNLKAREIRLSPAQTKNRDGRVIGYGWHGELAALLERRSKVCASEYVFCWPSGHRYAGRRVVDLTKPWKKACADASVPGRPFHDLRRTAVRNMIRAGVPETVAMTISGHRTRGMLDRYNITSTDDTREALRLVGRYHKAQKAKAKVVSMGNRKEATT